MTDYQAMKIKAKEIASRLMADLKAGTISKIGIEEIRYALRVERLAGEFDQNELEELTCRAVVESTL